MSAFYGNLLAPPTGLGAPGSGSVGGGEAYLAGHDAKYEAGYYGATASPTAATPGLGYDGGGGGGGAGDQHPGFPRFPPYDRLDIRPINGKAGFTLPPYQNTAAVAAAAAMGPYAMHGGQYLDDLTTCKLPDPGALAVSQAGGQAAAAGMMSPFGLAPGLSGMVNGMGPTQSHNLPIYPWMRPMNGGKPNYAGRSVGRRAQRIKIIMAINSR